MKHRPTGKYYSRYQLNGKRTMKALGTDNASTAKLRHLDVLAKNERTRQSGVRVAAGKGSVGDILREALASYEQSSKHVAKSKMGFRSSVRRLERHWPACFGVPLSSTKPAKITNAQVERFANYLSDEALWRRHNTRGQRCGYGAVTANITLETLLRVMHFGKARGYISEVPFQLTGDLGRESLLKPEPKKKINFPTQQKIQDVFAAMRAVGNVPDNQPELIEYIGRRSNESADLAEFMAYTGARLQEAASWHWEDERDGAIILRGTKTESSRDREVPKIFALSDLLARMKARRVAEGRKASGRAFTIQDCRQALATACKREGVDRLNHHALRHLYATRCIESGVDIPTVARWLGHADGGALAMRTYGHLRKEHSEAQAAKVTFSV